MCRIGFVGMRFVGQSSRVRLIGLIFIPAYVMQREIIRRWLPINQSKGQDQSRGQE